MSAESVPLLDFYIKAVSEKKAQDLIVLDVRGLTDIADVFIICSGRSNRQVNAIADAAVASLKNHKIKPLSVEGTREGHCVWLDYGHVIRHVFYEPIRKFFDLEGLWADAKRITTPAMRKMKSKS